MTRRRSNRAEIEEHKRLRHLFLLQARRPSETFPGVKSAKIRITFEDPDDRSTLGPSILDFSPFNRAYFEIDCPYRECVMGGFDLSPAVNQLIAMRQVHGKGQSTCQGWQDTERIHRHRCLLKADYEIQIEYNGDESNIKHE